MTAFFNRARVALNLFLVAALAVSLAYSVSIKDGHADVPVADSADEIQPLKVGDAAPYFSVRDVNGDAVEFDPAALERPAVLITFRGGWCPYCNLHLSELRHVLPELDENGIDVLFLSGDRPEQLVASLRPETQTDVEDLDYTLLSDAEATAAIALGIAFRTRTTGLKLRAIGRDIKDSSLDKHGVLPVPAVFAIGTDGKIAFAYANPDYKERLSADELREVANKL
ncbi:MAG: peroxiredoxin-like family protein [Pseudomonadota bacterium]